MPESSIVVQPEPTDSGSYTAASRLQAAGLQSAIAVFERAAAAAPIPSPPQPIVIADYGASSGHNSLLPIGAAIAVLAQADPPRTLRARRPHRHARQRFHRPVPDAGGGSGLLSAQGPRDLRLGGGPVLLFTDPALQQCQPRLEFLGDPMVEPGSRRHRRPPPCGLLRRRFGARRLRQASRAGLAQTFVAFRGRGAVSRWPSGRDDDGRRRRRRVRLPAAAGGDDGQPRRGWRWTGCSPPTRCR